MTPALPGCRVFQTRQGADVVDIEVSPDGRFLVNPADLPRRFSELGNCWNAALATLAGVPLEEVPERDGTIADALEDPESVFVSQQRWLATRGLRLAWAQAVPVGWAIASGALDGSGHSVVVYAGELVHDPGGGDRMPDPVWEYAALVQLSSLGVAVFADTVVDSDA